MSGNGTPTTYYILEFRYHTPRTLPGGRIIKVTWPRYYKKKGEETDHLHLSPFLSRDLAEQLKQLYPEKNPTVREESAVLGDEHIFATLDELGEAVSVSELEATIRAALRVLSKNEVQASLDKVLAE